MEPSKKKTKTRTPFDETPNQRTPLPETAMANMAGFGFSTSTSTPSFGSTFGTSTTTTAGSTGFSFGSAAKTTSTPSFGLGSAFGTTSTPSFGTAGSTGFSLGGLGSTATSTTSTPSFSFGLGATSTPSFSFGTSTAPTSSAPTLSFGGLGQPATTTTSGFSFGGLGQSTLGTSGLSFGTTTAQSLPTFSFGTGLGGLGSTTTTTSALGGSGLSFGSGLGTNPFSFGTQAGGTAAQTAATNAVANIATALSLPVVFGDERDTVIARWNQLQAFWGTGKAYFASSAPPVDLTPENPFCRFKAVGYSCLPSAKPEDGVVALTFSKKDSELRTQQQAIIDHMHRVFGSKQNISVCIAGLKPLPDDKTEVTIYLVERNPNGSTRKIPAFEVHTYLEQATIKNQLTSLGITCAIPKVKPSKEQLQCYLENPPSGIDPLLWQQAKLDNPDPSRLIPVPMIGFSELQKRLKSQEHETKQHQERLDIIAEEIAELQRRHTTTVAKIEEHKRKQLELGHRVLKVMVRQEIARKLGFAIQADEEQLRIQLEAIQAELSAPTQFKGRLNELISQIRMYNHQLAAQGDGEKYSLDTSLQDEIKQHLRYQQEGISHLISILKEDMEDLKIMESGLKEILDKRR